MTQIILPFAQSRGWETIEKDNFNTPGIDSEVYSYRKVYGTQQTPTEVKDALVNILTKHDYQVKSRLISDADYDIPYSINPVRQEFRIECEKENEGNPYWIIQGKNVAGDRVRIRITDKKYNCDRKIAPQGMTTISIAFYHSS